MKTLDELHRWQYLWRYTRAPNAAGVMLTLLEAYEGEAAFSPQCWCDEGES